MFRFSSLLFGLLAMALIGALVVGCAAASSPAATSAPGARPAAGNPSGVNSGELSGETDSTGQAPGPLASDAPLIVHTGSMSLEVADLRATIEQATALVSSLGGSIAESHEQNSDGHQGATVTYRIPAERWTEALAGLRALGQRVLSEDTDAQDVTAQVIDLDARIANLQASELALQGIMGRATTISDVLKVQQELTAVRGDIESMIAQRDELADQAALGTLEVAYSVPVDEAAVATSGWDFGREVDGAFAALVRVGQGLASLTVWLLIVVLPVLIPLGLIVLVAVRVRRWYLARRPAPRAPSV